MDIRGAHVQNRPILPGIVRNGVRLHADCNLFGALHRGRMPLLGPAVPAEVHSVHLAAGRGHQLAVDDCLPRGDGGGGGRAAGRHDRLLHRAVA